MLLELLSEFDPFLSEHIKSHDNAGKGSVFYFSPSICNEFIEIMANQVSRKIIDSIKKQSIFQ